MIIRKDHTKRRQKYCKKPEGMDDFPVSSRHSKSDEHINSRDYGNTHNTCTGSRQMRFPY